MTTQLHLPPVVHKWHVIGPRTMTGKEQSAISVFLFRLERKQNTTTNDNLAPDS
jgi:hypothetical protein